MENDEISTKAKIASFQAKQKLPYEAKLAINEMVGLKGPQNDAAKLA